MTNTEPKNTSDSGRRPLQDSRFVSDIRPRKPGRVLVNVPAHSSAAKVAASRAPRNGETPNLPKLAGNTASANVEDFFAPRTQNKVSSRDKSAAPAGDLEVKAWRPGDRRKSKLLAYVGGGLGALAGLAVMLSTVFAGATLVISPVTAVISIPPTAIRVTPDARAMDVRGGVIPGELIEFSETGQLNSARATGKKFVKENARGTLTIYNAYSSQPQVLVAGTRFASADGKIFKLVKGLTVPGAKVKNGEIEPSTVKAEVAAPEPGAEYNLAPSTFKIPGFQGTPKYQAFTAKSEAAFQGGFNGDTTVATESDIKQASERVTAELFAFLKNALTGKIPQDFMVIDGARNVEITSVSPPPVGTRGEQFSITATGRVRALAFRPADEGNFVAALLSTSTPYVLVSEKSSLSRSAINFDLSKRQLSLALSGTAALGARIDEDRIKNDTAGKTADEIKQILGAYPGVRAYQLKFFPFWMTRSPKDPASVKITVEPFAF